MNFGSYKKDLLIMGLLFLSLILIYNKKKERKSNLIYFLIWNKSKVIKVYDKEIKKFSIWNKNVLFKTIDAISLDLSIHREDQNQSLS